MSEYSRIQYRRCKVFGDGKGGKIAHERNIYGEDICLCYGATTDPTEWADICEECHECPKYIRNFDDRKWKGGDEK